MESVGGETGVVIEWELQDGDESQITGIELSWTPSTDGAPEMPILLPAGTTDYTVQGVEINVRYEFRLVAIYDDGYRSTGQTAMKFAIPHDPVLSLEVLSETSIKAMWELPDPPTGVLKRPILNYELGWERTVYGDQNGLAFPGPGENHYVVTDMQTGTEYKFALRARGLGDSGFTEQTATTLGPSPTPTPTSTPTPSPTPTPTPTPFLTPTPSPTPPPIPTPTPTPTPDPHTIDVDFDRLEGKNAVVKWHFADDVVTNVERFEVSWTPVTNAAPVMPVVLAPSVREYSIPNVEAKIRYAIKVDLVATNGDRLSDTVDLILDIPLEPNNVKRTQLSDSSILIEWEYNQDPKDTAQRPVSEYEISWRIAVPGIQPVVKIVNGGDRSTIIGPLDPNKTYEVTISALNAFGSGEAYIETVEIATPTPTSSPTRIPGQTPTPTATMVASLIPPQSKPKVMSRSSGLTDPEPPTDFYAVQGREGVRLFWDEPDYDGGIDVLAYAVDWMPEPPPFPIFVPPNQESIELFGLRTGVRYRTRVKAFNRIDDSMPSAQRITLTDTLVRFRSYDPYTGSVSSGRSTVLENKEGLPGFELHSDEGSLFWGDYMTVAVRKLEVGDAVRQFMGQSDLELVSEVFGVTPSVGSRRQRFDDSSPSYQFVAPLNICLSSSTSKTHGEGDLSVVRFSEKSGYAVLDSTTRLHGETVKTCAKVRQFDLGRETLFALAARHQLRTTNQNPVISSEGRPTGNKTMALLLLILGPSLIFVGLRKIS